MGLAETTAPVDDAVVLLVYPDAEVEGSLAAAEDEADGVGMMTPLIDVIGVKRADEGQ